MSVNFWSYSSTSFFFILYDVPRIRATIIPYRPSTLKMTNLHRFISNLNLGEDQDEDHSNKKSRLLGCASNTCIADNSNRIASTKSTEPARETSSQMGETLCQCVALTRRLHLSFQHHCHDQSIDTNNTLKYFALIDLYLNNANQP
jgi:hypothetical protein